MLTEEQIKHVAKLAKLEISDAEVEKFQKQLSEVFDYFNILEEVNTSGIEPTSHVTGLTNVFRTDKVRPCQTQKEALLGAAQKEKDMFKVKRLIE
ncbi:Asp-tRNA(Asn)/Glu-tRNA(Gln) amidotransferase GatCAB subunit C [Candidatus Shapirobacteria bacterium CG08_land_8_20_14_0_20_39_18]|uniref:Aspartyl/glutamyl-tRNA(Asn/Gln) amidotransferase subunit C n=1 Tax=Candidatus Shapirobacteria bacterium CG08_land_8_20_14_0_20_39_18 TaxID=1974883 RepID=A0A2M6XBU3_9BACT|nr:MAG: Asp-tRNA(Asn)/Glu-tRNA(Gln) amidotransferase GatCAB subunit C [Candidatus Shapirobacteria bacterium CG08_land_8_20_14_0_20_39_18]PIY65320.1 MAG: Asp-tRNA(Asn)/Glu-tRNA(Gln) amidotransferase GatCAB subunit C [Candidatus Shapirobacteria bacterium CG_4_10_14_0_8_um_filter_39_15]PJE68473.1 MAG: Asp-tRNA(Asn)/Glu-tRNA(Gln) amidotransferase GatCAB subunit C [Candidatus Shapirobacteria bacterium CG10_big_fil_rev_8_21_14_0_10_38_8]